MTVDIYKQKIGALIQDTRQAKGMTQAQLAALIGTSQSAINRIEKGGQNISLEMVARISDVLSTNILKRILDLQLIKLKDVQKSLSTAI